MKVNLKLLVGQIIYLLVYFSLALFLSAGTLAWPAGWVFMVLFFSFVIALTAWLFKHDPALLKERMTMAPSDQKLWDRIFLIVTYILFTGWFVLMALDAVRFRWSQVPLWLQVGGALILLGSFYLFFATFKENTFLSPVVRVQKEREQTVVSTGPYHYVRHPMYSAFLIFAIGTTLLLGSWYGLLLGLIIVISITRRIILEERTLQDELQGYTTYMGQVRYRLIPYVW
jgi:protein-S-isoprenylcysteine O-methyltransferase Ste14